jgi:hypothetical protein
MKERMTTRSVRIGNRDIKLRIKLVDKADKNRTTVKSMLREGFGLSRYKDSI